MKEKNRVEDLGQVEGKLLFFGGVYGNFHALQALKDYADKHQFQSCNIFCTGDVAGYCAQPVECIQLIRDWKIHSIAGNVELQIGNDKEDCGCDFTSGGRCDLFSKNWYDYTRKRINRNDKEWMHSLPEFIRFSYYGNQVTILHGSWFHTADFIFKSTSWQRKQENFAAANANVIVAGHCGLPFDDVKDGLFWLNAGVIGMPANDGTKQVWFLTVEQKESGFAYTFHHLEYDNEMAAKQMRENGLPQSYASTLSTGIWDNCEILPEAETSAQGKPLFL